MVAALAAALADGAGACSTELVFGHRQVTIPPGGDPARSPVVAFISGWSNVVAVRGRSRTFLVDAKQSGGTKEMLTWLEHDGFPSPYVVGITHVHIDHVEGLIRMLEKDRVERIVGPAPMSEYLQVPGKFQGYQVESPVEVEPGFRVQIIPLGSAHTGADAAYYFPDHHVLATGDVFQCGYYPHAELIDGGSFQGIVAALDLLLKLPNVDYVVGGHGEVCHRPQLEAYRHHIAALVGGHPAPPLDLHPLRGGIRTIASHGRVATCAAHERDKVPRPWPRRLPPERRSCKDARGGKICWLEKGIICTGREDGC
jgi:glyoxylase-like metal-dependent hydrolase (beta-lactamase superfamily II)